MTKNILETSLGNSPVKQVVKMIESREKMLSHKQGNLLLKNQNCTDRLRNSHAKTGWKSQEETVGFP